MEDADIKSRLMLVGSVLILAALGFVALLVFNTSSDNAPAAAALPASPATLPPDPMDSPLPAEPVIEAPTPTSETAHNQAVRRWELVGQQGDMRFVFIPAAHSESKSEYHMAVGSLCAGKTHCYVSFWQDRAKTPTRLPLTNEQVAAQVAGYIMNTARSKSDWAWRCDKFPDTDPARCF